MIGGSGRSGHDHECGAEPLPVGEAVPDEVAGSESEHRNQGKEAAGDRGRDASQAADKEPEREAVIDHAGGRREGPRRGVGGQAKVCGADGPGDARDDKRR